MLGYLAVAILNAHVNYGLSVTTREIQTGPGVVDASNVDADHQRRESGRPLGRGPSIRCRRTAHRLFAGGPMERGERSVSLEPSPTRHLGENRWHSHAI